MRQSRKREPKKISPMVRRAELENIQTLRRCYLQETNFQIRYDACHVRGWTDFYLLVSDGLEIGYGSIKGRQIAGRDTVFEFYVIPPFRQMLSILFAELLAVSGAKYLECQSNDHLMSAMMFEFGSSISSDTMLFEDHAVTALSVAEGVVRPRRDDDQIFEHKAEPEGSHILEIDGEVWATGGFLLHYNLPFADLYMEVREDGRRRGYGSFLLQEVKRACYAAGRVPAARCSIKNAGSRATLIRAGMRACGFMLSGRVKANA